MPRLAPESAASGGRVFTPAVPQRSGASRYGPVGVAIKWDRVPRVVFTDERAGTVATCAGCGWLTLAAREDRRALDHVCSKRR